MSLGSQKSQWEIAQLTINPSDPLLESVLPVPSGFCKVRGPGSPKGAGNTITRGHSKNPIKL